MREHINFDFLDILFPNHHHKKNGVNARFINVDRCQPGLEVLFLLLQTNNEFDNDHFENSDQALATYR